MLFFTDTTENLVLLFTDRLTAAGLQYMVTGSVASMLYGEPRLTHDVDLVLELSTDDQIAALGNAFTDEEFYCAPPEVVRVEARRRQRGHFNVIHHLTGFKADIYLVGSDPLHRQAMQRRRETPIGQKSIWLAPPEYVIVRKLEYFREGGSEKHLQDIRGMLVSSDQVVDLVLLEQWISQLGLNAEWARVHVSG